MSINNNEPSITIVTFEGIHSLNELRDNKINHLMTVGYSQFEISKPFKDGELLCLKITAKK